MNAIRAVSTCMLAIYLTVVQTACQPKRIPPVIPDPVPGYVPVQATTDEAWDAVVDFLVDNGIQFDFISADMRVAKVSAIIATGPIAGPRGTYRVNTTALRFADCGTLSDVPLAGWGILLADIAVRVRPAGTPASLLKVVIPRLRVRVGLNEYECVSKGAFEAQAEESIGQRLRPIMKTGGR